MEENGKRYRLLNVGEEFQEGDEYKATDFSKMENEIGHYSWMQLGYYYHGHVVTDAEKNNSFPYGWYRRPIMEEDGPSEQELADNEFSRQENEPS